MSWQIVMPVERNPEDRGRGRIQWWGLKRCFEKLICLTIIKNWLTGAVIKARERTFGPASQTFCSNLALPWDLQTFTLCPRGATRTSLTMLSWEIPRGCTTAPTKRLVMRFPCNYHQQTPYKLHCIHLYAFWKTLHFSFNLLILKKASQISIM